MDAVTHPPQPVNEPVLDYAPGSAERAALVDALAGFADPLELPAIIAGERHTPGGEPFDVRAPFDHGRVLGTSAHSVQADATKAVDAAIAAAAGWRELDFDSRAAILLRAADLLAGPWRARINAATVAVDGSRRSARTPDMTRPFWYCSHPADRIDMTLP